MCVPRALGGGEVDPATMIRTIEIIAAADGAAGWSAMIGATSGVASAYLAEDAAREIYGSDPEVVSGGAFAPLGRATVVDGGYRVTGRWPFASGCEHCAWLMGGSVVLDGGQPRLLPSGMPDNRLMLFPAAQVRIIDTWDVAGLRGTGSHDIAVEDRFVPAARSLSLIADPPRTRRAGRAGGRQDADRQPPPPGGAAGHPRRGRPGGGDARRRARLPRGDRGRRLGTRAGSGGDRGSGARAPAARGHPRDPRLGARRRSHVRRGWWHGGLRGEPAPALLPRHPRGDPAHDGGARDARAGRPHPARPRGRHRNAMTSEDFATLKLARVGHVLRVTIDHPSSALNAVDERLHHDLTALCAGLKREAEARAVLLTGRGPAFP